MAYPILKGKWDLSKSKLLDYTKTFPSNKLIIQSTDEYTITTKHWYYSGLVIELTWKFKFAPEIDFFINASFSDFLHKKETGEIELIKGEVATYSDPSSTLRINSAEEDVFFRIIDRQDDFSYQELEYNVEVPSSIPDNFFIELIKDINSYIEFEEYYQKRMSN